MWQNLRVTHEEFTHFSVIVSWDSITNHTFLCNENNLCSAVPFKSLQTLQGGILQAIGEPILHTFHQLLFTRLFPTHFVKLNLQVFYKAYPDPSKLFGYLYCKLTKLTVFLSDHVIYWNVNFLFIPLARS